MRVYIPRTVTVDGREVEALVPIEAGAESFEAETGVWTRLTTAWENRPAHPSEES